ncbi:uncharacterized protein DNG_06119 [Cephalotrichum gorgonifer]|uniref:Uncharacterized protein n=1 Tax=Cephalotrichum gorgonifer TaxID=2041049 RepID=A0AAE8SW51_9PEZI|nr:uncharacterized protein DNG_06119 [Cephalotrichum gorgonifer]
MGTENVKSLQTAVSKVRAVETEMCFLKRDALWDHEKPYRMRYVPIGNVPKTNFLLETIPVRVRDARNARPTLSLDTNGFEFHDLSSELDYDEFFDYDRVRSVYMREVQDLLKKVCRAKHVHPLDYELRRRHESFPISTGKSYAFGQPNLIAHIDITLEGLREIVREVYGDHADEILKSRVQCVTVWKPIKGPVRDWPLALCDSTTLRDPDVIPADAVYERVVAENAMIHSDPTQAWYYLGDQKASEVLVFKAADSDPASATRCAHGSFHLPGMTSPAPRESIDVRALVMHADIDYPTAAEWFT